MQDQPADLPRAKRTWHRPTLTPIGNLRDFVRVGFANGKSGGNMDGNANAGGEAMYQHSDGF
jgi:hypothetical protein